MSDIERRIASTFDRPKPVDQRQDAYRLLLSPESRKTIGNFLRSMYGQVRDDAFQFVIDDTTEDIAKASPEWLEAFINNINHRFTVFKNSAADFQIKYRQERLLSTGLKTEQQEMVTNAPYPDAHGKVEHYDLFQELNSKLSVLNSQATARSNKRLQRMLAILHGVAEGKTLDEIGSGLGGVAKQDLTKTYAKVRREHPEIFSYLPEKIVELKGLLHGKTSQALAEKKQQRKEQRSDIALKLNELLAQLGEQKNMFPGLKASLVEGWIKYYLGQGALPDELRDSRYQAVRIKDAVGEAIGYPLLPRWLVSPRWGKAGDF